jgi:peptidoglycan hydrolase CwlO-like protein
MTNLQDITEAYLNASKDEKEQFLNNLLPELFKELSDLEYRISAVKSQCDLVRSENTALKSEITRLKAEISANFEIKKRIRGGFL